MTGCAVLLSVGRHPESGRRRLAEAEASAIALAASAGFRPLVVHAGRPADADTLRPALGMGAERLDLLEIEPGEDPFDRLARHLRTIDPDLVLAGRSAETGEASGFLPFVLAERLGRPLIADCASLSAAPGGGWQVATALPGGSRRHLRAYGPLILTVGAAGPPPRYSAYAAARRGRIAIVAGEAAAAAGEPEAPTAAGEAHADRADPRLGCPARRARAMPRPIPSPPSGDPAERLAAILGDGRSAPNRRLQGLGAEAAAAAILEELRSAGCLPPPRPPENAS